MSIGIAANTACDRRTEGIAGSAQAIHDEGAWATKSASLEHRALRKPPGARMKIAPAVAATALAIASLGAALAAERSIDKQIDVAASLDEVWGAWTTRDGIRSFFAPDANIDARVGGAFQIYMDPLAEPGLKGFAAAPAAAPPPASAVEAALAAIDPDSLTPRDALDALYRLKKLQDETRS